LLSFEDTIRHARSGISRMVKPGLTRSALTGDNDGNAGDSAFDANRRIEKVTGFGNLVRSAKVVAA
jgi:hypothetical protein